MYWYVQKKRTRQQQHTVHAMCTGLCEAAPAWMLAVEAVRPHRGRRHHRRASRTTSRAHRDGKRDERGGCMKSETKGRDCEMESAQKHRYHILYSVLHAGACGRERYDEHARPVRAYARVRTCRLKIVPGRSITDTHTHAHTSRLFQNTERICTYVYIPYICAKLPPARPRSTRVGSLRRGGSDDDDDAPCARHSGACCL